MRATPNFYKAYKTWAEQSGFLPPTARTRPRLRLRYPVNARKSTFQLLHKPEIGRRGIGAAIANIFRKYLRVFGNFHHGADKARLDGLKDGQARGKIRQGLFVHLRSPSIDAPNSEASLDTGATRSMRGADDVQ